MSIPTFHQWLEAMLNEKGARTSLGPYPRAYGYAGTHPPLASTPIAGGAAGQLQKYHKDVINDTNPPPKKKKKKK